MQRKKRRDIDDARNHHDKTGVTPFLVRKCKTDNYELYHHSCHYQPKEQPRGAIEAVVAIEAPKAVLLSWRRRGGNLCGVLRTCQMIDRQVSSLVTKSGTVLLEERLVKA